jgi:hypothetical protein
VILVEYWWFMKDIMGTLEIVWRLDRVFTRGERARERKTEVASISATVTEHNLFRNKI